METILPIDKHSNPILDPPDDVVPLSMWWGRELFLSKEAPDGKCPATIDLTGRARILSYGPYAPLAPGAWRARARLDLCADAARCRLSLQFGAMDDFTETPIQRTASGRHEVDVDHICRNAGLAELRIVLLRAAFHGEIRFHGVEILRLGSDGLPRRRD